MDKEKIKALIDSQDVANIFLANVMVKGEEYQEFEGGINFDDELLELVREIVYNRFCESVEEKEEDINVVDRFGSNIAIIVPCWGFNLGVFSFLNDDDSGIIWQGCGVMFNSREFIYEYYFEEGFCKNTLFKMFWDWLVEHGQEVVNIIYKKYLIEKKEENG